MFIQMDVKFRGSYIFGALVMVMHEKKKKKSTGNTEIQSRQIQCTGRTLSGG